MRSASELVLFGIYAYMLTRPIDTMHTILPIELVDMVFTWARFIPQKDVADFRTLAACSRVCKDWRAPAQALLFRDIPISLCHHKRSLFIRSLSGRPSLGRHIRSFGIEISSPPVPWGRDPPKLSPKRFRNAVADFINILTHAPNITRLAIDIDGELEAEDVTKLEAIDLRHMDVLNWEGRPTSSVLYQLLALWPSIRYLRIDHIYFDPLPDDARLRALRGLCVRDELSEGAMTWLLPPAAAAQAPLRELQFESGLPSCWALKDVEAHAPALHVLAVDRIPPQGFLDSLTALRELAFCELPCAPLRLPRGVRCVRLHAKYQRRPHQGPGPGSKVDAPSSEIREEGRSDRGSGSDEVGYLTRALAELPELELVCATRQTPEGVLASLEGLCREARVEFVVYDRSAIFSRWRSLI
ncbi:hypothetical protein BC834DRAFT_970954 [Gloeopeniophorella convolvens]|nr:hypothetical protein BC834DRAFT_970954 [Gloeopeniophorella convolvens]